MCEYNKTVSNYEGTKINLYYSTIHQLYVLKFINSQSFFVSLRIVKQLIYIIVLISLPAFKINAQSKSEAFKKVNADSLITFCKKQLGIKYNYANCEPETGFDCSGFVYYVFEHFKVKVPRSSIDYENFGKKISMDSCKTGDVIVFTGTDATRRKPGHVGIIISKPGEDLKFIHSSSDKKHSGIKISDYSSSSNYKKRFLKIVRVANVK